MNIRKICAVALAAAVSFWGISCAYSAENSSGRKAISATSRGATRSTGLPDPDDLIALFKGEGVPAVFESFGEWQKQEYCGVNCAYLLLRMHGSPVTHAAVEKAAGKVPQGGISVADIARLCERFGLRCEIAEGNVKALAALAPPTVLYIGDPNDPSHAGHFILFVDRQGANKERMRFIDGTTGMRFEIAGGDSSWLERNWSGILVRPRRDPAVTVVRWTVLILGGVACALWLQIGVQRLFESGNEAAEGTGEFAPEPTSS